MKEKKALLVVSFGTSYDETLEKTIEACEKRLAEAFPDYDQKRAFTSHMIIRKLKRVKGVEIDTPAMAVEKLLIEQYTHLLVQPLHIIPGEEYNRKVLASILPFKYRFQSFKVGKPLLYHFSDYGNTLDAIEKQLPPLGEDEAVVLMGHGSTHPANSTYSCLQSLIDDRKLPLHIGCVEGYPYLDRVVKRLSEKTYRKIHLMPLMLVAGDHASNDMAGNDEESWKVVLEKIGYETECHMTGLGENIFIQECFVNKAKDAVREAV